MEFKLKTEFIELDNLLKALHLVSSGAQAGQKIRAGLILVNGAVESRVRRKLRAGDGVDLGGQKINIIAQGRLGERCLRE